LYAAAIRVGAINPAGAPSEGVVTLLPREFKTNGTRRAVIILHGHNAIAVTPLAMAQYLAGPTLLGDVVAALRLGLPILAIDAGGGQTYGNDVAIARLDEAVDWVSATGLGKAQPILLGTSMGSILAVNYAARHPTKIKAVGLLYTAMDLQFTHDQNVAEVEAAYGGASAFTAALASHSGIPQAQAGALAGVDLKGWYSTNDAVVGVGTWGSFRAAFIAGGGGALAEASLGAVGHGDNTLVPVDDVAAWLSSRL
jgi:pimeloyl-ACP methyl ester carboxylesterase